MVKAIAYAAKGFCLNSIRRWVIYQDRMVCVLTTMDALIILIILVIVGPSF